jgi:hypothetical protein
VKTIVIAQRGFVFVGDVSTDGDELVISNASTIRRWGTEKGLGELCDGPLESTVLDSQGETRIHRLAVVATIRCDGWI